jgi:hypothetical protein
MVCVSLCLFGRHFAVTVKLSTGPDSFLDLGETNEAEAVLAMHARTSSVLAIHEVFNNVVAARTRPMGRSGHRFVFVFFF